MEDFVLLQSLAEEVASIKATLDEAKEAGQILNEAQTEFIIIDPLLKRLGYSPLETLKRSHDGVANNFPDYTILGNKPQKWFLEAKRLDLQLQDGEAAQAVNYANNQGAEWAILTNGRKWYIYNAHLPKPLPEKRVLQIEDLFNDEQALQTLSLLSKSSILKNELREAWLFQQVTRLVDEQLKTPSSEARKLFQHLCNENIGSSVSDTMIGSVIGKLHNISVKASTPGAVPLVPLNTKQEPNNKPVENAVANTSAQSQPTDAGSVALPSLMQKGEIKQYTIAQLYKNASLSVNRRPVSVGFGNEMEHPVKRWAEVAVRLVEWLHAEHGFGQIPFPATENGERYLINHLPIHPNGEQMRSPKPINLTNKQAYVDTHSDTAEKIRNFVILLQTMGVDPGTVTVRLV